MDAKLETPIYITLRKMNGLRCKVSISLSVSNWNDCTVTLKLLYIFYLLSLLRELYIEIKINNSVKTIAIAAPVSSNHHAKKLTNNIEIGAA